MKKHTRVHSFVIAVCFILIAAFGFNTQVSAVSTDGVLLGLNTTMPVFSATVNTSNGTRTYKVFDQKALGKKKSYIALHGCAVSSLTCVLSSYVPAFANYTPINVYKSVEKQVFGNKTWNRNYKKSVASQSPVSLYGISRVLNYYKISNTYVRKFTNASAAVQIKNHLATGRPVIFEANNHKQVNGKFSKKYDTKWASSKHTMVLLGLTKSGLCIVADSATRKWSGTQQRIKYAPIEELVKYMIPCRKSGKNCYFNGIATDGGYILINAK